MAGHRLSRRTGIVQGISGVVPLRIVACGLLVIVVASIVITRVGGYTCGSVRQWVGKGDGAKVT